MLAMATFRDAALAALGSLNSGLCFTGSEGYTLNSPLESLLPSTYSARGRVAVSTRNAYWASASEPCPTCMDPCAGADRRLCFRSHKFLEFQFVLPTLDPDSFADRVRRSFNSMARRGAHRRLFSPEHGVERCWWCDGFLAGDAGSHR